jgi:hypothetical protein
MQSHHLLSVMWCDMQDFYILSIVHDDRMVDAPATKGTHKSDLLLAYCSFQRVCEVV